MTDQPALGLQDYWGKAVISVWAARDIIGEWMMLKLVNVVLRYGRPIVTAHVDGLFGKRGLTDPSCWPSTSHPKTRKSFN